MSGLFGGDKGNSSQPTRALGIRVQTSVYGMCIPIVFGKTRVSGNLLWYGDFQAKEEEMGGKGGGGGTSGYKYKASIIMGICEGPIVDVPRVWIDKKRELFADSPFGSGTLKLGSYTQTAWSYMTSAHPTEAMAYIGTCYVGGLHIDLGSSADLPNFNFEVEGRLCGNVTGEVDANPAEIIEDLATNSHYGGGFRADNLDLDLYSDYCLATGLLLSPAYSEQQALGEIIQTLADLTNSAVVWTGSMLKIVPYGDERVTGNDVTYQPPSPLEYSLTLDDFKNTQEDPVEIERKRRADAYNIVKLEYWNRDRNYDPDTINAKDQSAIELYGERPLEATEAHCICVAEIAQQSAQLMLQRQSVLNTYRFVLGWEYILIEPMDLIPITDTGLGLDAEVVRIIQIDEDEDGYLTVLAEEYIQGLGTAEPYLVAEGQGYRPGRANLPGDVNTPVMFEPTAELVAAKGVPAGLQIWAALSGGADWGGCEIWVSTDGGTNYYKQGTTLIGRPSVQGELTADLPLQADPDTVNTLAIDVTQSAGTITSGTSGDADQFNTLSLVDGEFVAYSTATLTSAYNYDLTTYIRRGLFGTTPGLHATGTSFARIDDNVTSRPMLYDSGLIGTALKVKFLSFNLYGLKRQALSDVSAYTFTPTGVSDNGASQTYVDDHIGKKLIVTSQFDTTSTTLATVTGLSVSVVSGQSYIFSAVLSVTADASGGHKYSIGGGALASSIRYHILALDRSTGLNVISSEQTALGGAGAGESGATSVTCRIEGSITVSASGTLDVRFAQNASGGTSSVLTASSFIVTPIS